MDLCDKGEMRALLSRHGFRFSKRLGQNFLIDGRIPKRIAEGLTSEHGVLEIGPGIGSLTRALCEKAGRVVSVELDRTLLPILGETLAPYDNFELISGDILSLSISELVRTRLGGFLPVVCANLPYQISTPVMTALLESACFRRITVMLQKEVAERICAKPGTGAYGAFSVFCQYYAAAEVLFDVPPDCFLPAPKVTSSVIQLTPFTSPPVCPRDEALFFGVVRAAFAQRRKTLRNGLFARFSARLGKEEISGILKRAGLDEAIRGECLGLSEFAELSDLFYAALHPGSE